MAKIASIETVDFGFEVPNIEQIGAGHRRGYRKGARLTAIKNAIAIEAEGNLRGECVTDWGASPATRGEMEMLAPFLIGRNAFERGGILDDLKREMRQWSGMGHGPLDMALWDLAGKAYAASISELIGGHRKRLPA